MSSASAATSYDEIPYPNNPVRRSHPDRLAPIATLFGMQPAPVDRCRVLELGCASGANLLPMAARHPHSSFVGIDNSPVQIGAARTLLDKLGLENIELRCASIADVGDELGTFDYIVAHGVFSWIAPPLQERLLDLCQRHLNEQGLAYVSYNIYPGWHRSSLIREVLLRTTSAGNGRQRLAEARAVLQFLAAGLARQSTDYAAVVKQEIDALLAQPLDYLYHEHLEDENHPLYFHEFVERADAYGLKFVAEASLTTMFTSNFGPRVQSLLAPFAGDEIAREQHIDVLLNRSFRQTLLCRRQVALSRELAPDRLRSLYFAAQFTPQDDRPQLATSDLVAFTTPKGLGIASRTPLVKAGLYALARAWPGALSYDELLTAAVALVEPELKLPSSDLPGRDEWDETLLRSVVRGLVELFSLPDRFVTTISSRPRASQLARTQGADSSTVTNQRHKAVQLDAATRCLLDLLDGQHDREALQAALAAAVERGDVAIGVDLADRQAVAHEVRETLEHALRQLALHALLVE